MIFSLWILANEHWPGKPQVIYALGPDEESAWINAISILYGIDYDEREHPPIIADLKARGWTARRCKVKLLSKEPT